MEDVEALKVRISELEAKVADRNARLQRAWKALESVQTSLRRRTSPGAFHPETRSFKELGKILADGVESEISKRDRKFINLSNVARRAYSWVGRAPRNEKEAEELKAIKKTFDQAICGIIEGESFQGFYDDHPPMGSPTLRPATAASPECDSPTTEAQPAEPPPAPEA